MHVQIRTLVTQVIVLAQYSGTLGWRNASQMELGVHVEDSFS